MISCVLFDRDGTLGELEDKRFPQSLHLFCDVRAAFSLLKEKGYFAGIITNQSSIARGTAGGYDFAAEFKEFGVDVWKLCPHDVGDHCDCRKPKSGLLLAAAKELGVAPQECLVVGDRLSDVLCAKNVGAEAALVLTGYGKEERESVLSRFPQTPVYARFDDVCRALPPVRK